MKKEKLLVEFVAGYMLKVLKRKNKILLFDKEFKAIRHGDYDEFINLLNCEKPFMVYSNIETGEIRTENLTQKNTCDFAGLLLAGPSLKKFYFDCKKEYGEIVDSDISDEIFQKLVHFELSLRMYGNHHNLLSDKDVLKDVINKVGHHKILIKKEIEALHQGRKFLNMVKHNDNQFITYAEGIEVFNLANSILEKHDLTIQ